jgi:DNA-binding protein HU-beta
MNKSDLVDRVAEATGEAKTRILEIVDITIDTVQGALVKGEKVTIPGFGTFQARARKARTGRNPRTGASVKIPATTIPAFKAGQTLKDLVSGKAKLTVTRPAAKKSGSKTSTAKRSSAKKSPARKKTTARKR